MNDEPKTLFLVDDHEMLQIGLKTFLESKSNLKVVGTAKSIDTAKQGLAVTFPQMIIIDVELGEFENGFDLAAFIKETYPEMKIIMYSMHDESNHLLKAKELDIDGYVSKAADSQEFIKCIECICSGNKYIEGRLTETLNSVENVINLLTKKEALIFNEMLKGKSNEEIGKTLDMHKHSVEVYATTIYEKSFCANRTELMKKYRK